MVPTMHCDWLRSRAAAPIAQDILHGNVTVDLHVDFLSHHNHADLMILQNIKEAIPARSSVLHHATLVCHSFMQTGTTIDTFLLNNLEWLKRASNWARFSATAAQGAVHKGHVREAMRVLEPYLPRVRACVGPAPPLCCTHHPRTATNYRVGSPYGPFTSLVCEQ